MSPSEAELEILQVLWQLEPATVREVHDQVAAQREVGYTTTQKQMQRMVEKGFIAQHKTGRSHTFTALLRENQVKGSVFRRMVDTVFKGSSMELLLHALGDSDPSEEELAALEQWLEAKKQADADPDDNRSHS